MLDMSMFREKSEILRKDHDKRKIPHDNIDEVIRLDNEWKQARYEGARFGLHLNTDQHIESERFLNGSNIMSK